MKIIAIGDFHGSFPDKLKNRILKEKPDYIISIGDYGDNSKYRKIVFKNWDALSRISLKDLIGKKRFNKLMSGIKKSAEQMLQKLDKLGIKIFSITGNGEGFDKFTPTVLKKMFSKCKNIDLIYNQTRKLGDWQILGICSYRGVNAKLKEFSDIKETVKYKCKDIKWNLTLKKLFSKMKNPAKTIFLGHDVPYNTKMDMVDYPSSPMHGKHIGDEYFRKYIEKYQPALMICGHMHETQGKIKLGKTVVVNTGAAMDGQAAIIELSKKIKVEFIK